MPRVCPEDYWNCEYYIAEEPEGSQCKTNDTWGRCTEKIRIDEKLKNIGFNDDEINFIQQLCQIKKLPISKYIRKIMKGDLMNNLGIDDDDEIDLIIKQLYQVKNLPISEYIRIVVKEDLMNTGLLIINNIIEKGGK